MPIYGVTLHFSPDSVEKILEMYNKDDGTYLIRESRSSEGSYTLSLCHNARIKNFRISRDPDGTLSLRDPGGMQDPGRMLSLRDPDDGTPDVDKPVRLFATMAALIEHHTREKVGRVICHVTFEQAVPQTPPPPPPTHTPGWTSNPA